MFLIKGTEVAEAIEHYLMLFRQHRQKEHPLLKESQWEEIINTLFDLYDNYGSWVDISIETMMNMMDRHFLTEYQEGVDYNIMHFNTEGIQMKRYYETAPR